MEMWLLASLALPEGPGYIKWKIICGPHFYLIMPLFYIAPL